MKSVTLVWSCTLPLCSFQVDESMLKEAFNRLFYAIPSFIERYPDVVDTVKSVFFPPKSEGMFAFVEFVDDVLTTTAIAMSGFEYLGRRAVLTASWILTQRKRHSRTPKVKGINTFTASPLLQTTASSCPGSVCMLTFQSEALWTSSACGTTPTLHTSPKW